MKHYFNFHLTGRQFFLVWIIYYLLVLVPYFLLLRAAENTDNTAVVTLSSFLLLFLIMGGTLAYYYYFAKFCVNNLTYNERPFRFFGSFGSFIGRALPGLFLSGITFGIYIPWFIRSLMKYFTNNTSLEDSNFDFSGNAAQLLVILLLTLYLPIGLIITATLVITLLGGAEAMSAETPFFFAVFIQLAVFIILIPYIYFAYKWMVDIAYKDYRIEWKTKFWPSFLQILFQILLTTVTLGIYFPMAYLKLYKYFAERTFAESPTRLLNFGYELEAGGDFLFVWGQTLLSIITLGIYYPWAIAKVGKRVLSKSYTQVITESGEQPIILPPLPNIPAVEPKDEISGETL